MLDLLFRTADQAGRAVLQIRQRRFIIIRRPQNPTGIVPVELRIAFDVLATIWRVADPRFYLDRKSACAPRPATYQVLATASVHGFRYHCRGDIHGRALSQEYPYIKPKTGASNVFRPAKRAKALLQSLQMCPMLVDVRDQIIHTVLKPAMNKRTNPV